MQINFLSAAPCVLFPKDFLEPTLIDAKYNDFQWLVDEQIKAELLSGKFGTNFRTP